MVKYEGGSPLSARRTANDELSRASILDTARTLFIEKGYDNTSMRQVASALNCSHGAIYYHFKNKAELFHAIIEEDFLLLDGLMDEIFASTMEPKAKCRLLLLKYIEFGLTHKNHYEMMFMLKDAEVRGYIQKQPNTTYEKFAVAIHSLSNHAMTIKEIWSLFLSLHGFVSYYCYTEQTYDEMHTLAEAHVDFLLRGM